MQRIPCHQQAEGAAAEKEVRNVLLSSAQQAPQKYNACQVGHHDCGIDPRESLHVSRPLLCTPSTGLRRRCARPPSVLSGYLNGCRSRHFLLASSLLRPPFAWTMTALESSCFFPETRRWKSAHLAPEPHVDVHCRLGAETHVLGWKKRSATHEEADHTKGIC